MESCYVGCCRMRSLTPEAVSKFVHYGHELHTVGSDLHIHAIVDHCHDEGTGAGYHEERTVVVAKFVNCDCCYDVPSSCCDDCCCWIDS